MDAKVQIWLIPVLTAASISAAQPPSQTARHAVFISSGSAVYQVQFKPVGDELLREIDDPNTGQRWLLYRDASHPGGPGSLVQLDPQSIGRNKLLGYGVVSGSVAAAREDGVPKPSIHSGDRVILEEDTPVVEARLEAVALGAAVTGARLRVRILIGGQIIEAVALGAGRVGIPAFLGGRP
jgi:hypothetical protein